jgi:uncharacterized protein YgfB (UPF0149 family)
LRRLFTGEKVVLDALGDYETMPDWQESADVLLGVGLMLNPSELHGASTGLLATGMAHDTDEQKTAALGLLEKALAVDLHGESADFATRLMAATLSAARDTDFAFGPLLPDDDEAFEIRLTSLGCWATGFLTGFTQAVAAANTASEPVDPNTADSLKDFAAIAQIDIGEEDSDDNERELEELIDYLRLAALNILTDALSHQD